MLERLVEYIPRNPLFSFEGDKLTDHNWYAINRQPGRTRTDVSPIIEEEVDGKVTGKLLSLHEELAREKYDSPKSLRLLGKLNSDQMRLFLQTNLSNSFGISHFVYIIKFPNGRSD